MKRDIRNEWARLAGALHAHPSATHQFLNNLDRIASITHPQARQLALNTLAQAATATELHARQATVSSIDHGLVETVLGLAHTFARADWIPTVSYVTTAVQEARDYFEHPAHYMRTILAALEPAPAAEEHLPAARTISSIAECKFY